jgi:NAD-dependent DNA ligase
MTPAELETEVMAHRYLYYVVCRPVISDRDYDALEARAKAVVGVDSPVNNPGSDREQDYSDAALHRVTELIRAAKVLLRK